MSFNALNIQHDENTNIDIIKNIGFYPDLSLLQFEKKYRLPTSFDQELLKDGITQGMLYVNNQLRGWLARQGNIETLDDVDDVIYDGKSRLFLLYERAVFCHAKSILLLQYATIGKRKQAQDGGKESEENADKFQELCNAAINDFLDIPRIGIHSL